VRLHRVGALDCSSGRSIDDDAPDSGLGMVFCLLMAPSLWPARARRRPARPATTTKSDGNAVDGRAEAGSLCNGVDYQRTFIARSGGLRQRAPPCV